MILKVALLLADRDLGKSTIINFIAFAYGGFCSYLELASKMRDKTFIGKFRANNFTERLLTSLDKQTDEVGMRFIVDLGRKKTDIWPTGYLLQLIFHPLLSLARRYHRTDSFSSSRQRLTLDVGPYA